MSVGCNWLILIHAAGWKLKKSLGCLLATNWRNIVARCKFKVASLYNVNDAAHSMAQSRGKLALLMPFGTFFYDESKTR